MDLTGKTLRWRHHDEPALPQDVVGVVVRQITETSPYWVEAVFQTPKGLMRFAMRGSEGVEEPTAAEMAAEIKHWQKASLLSTHATTGIFTKISRDEASQAYAHGKEVFIRAGTKAGWRIIKNTLIHDAQSVEFCIRSP